MCMYVHYTHVFVSQSTLVSPFESMISIIPVVAVQAVAASFLSPATHVLCP